MTKWTMCVNVIAKMMMYRNTRPSNRQATFSRQISICIYGFVASLILLAACETGKNMQQEQGEPGPRQPALFTLLPAAKTQIGFQNTITEGANTNIFMYEYFYNGGGVAAGDVNGDGLIDLYFTSNLAENKLYLNKGNLRFEDITSASAAGGRPGPWKTGVTFVDINGDSKLDIYLSYSGILRDENRMNRLLINEGNDENGVPTFSDKAAEYGLASAAYSNQASFFDYDRDGDLDMLLLNHNPKSLATLNEVSTAKLLQQHDPLRGVRLLRQTNKRFEDVTSASSISSSPLTYALGVGIGDFNSDGWSDFYVSNDYTVPDYLYINNQNGTFTDRLQQGMEHTSLFSMGDDVADMNNDGHYDIVTLDMLPEDNRRQKLLMAPDNHAKLDLNVRTGFHYQYMRNMLQLNHGNGTFSETGQIAGISNTDWSWAVLLADYNNDGWKDMFVTNGYLRDYTNLDFTKYMEDYTKSKARLEGNDILEIIRHMPAPDVANYIFSNTDGVRFTNETKTWGMDRPSNSNGAAYADLDNDGDLDIIVNNINQPAFIYRNNANKNRQNSYLQVKLQGEGLNTQGIGAQVVISCGGKKQYLEQQITRGYLSSVTPVLHFGLGGSATVDTLTVTWPGGRQQTLTNIKANQRLTLSQKDAVNKAQENKSTSPLFVEITSPVSSKNPKIEINDFKRQPLLISQLSYSGPCMTKGDVNNDGLEDVYVGGGAGQPGALFIQESNKTFISRSISDFETDKESVDASAAFFDVDKDGDVDLYVVSGGYDHFATDDPILQDRLYLNDGKGHFIRSKTALPDMRTSKSCVAVNDVNGDGHPDVFVGGRVIPGRYPETPASYLLINDGKGNFTNQIKAIASELENIGMVTDAAWIDLDNDQKRELIVVGEWMPVSVFAVENNRLQNRTKNYFEEAYSGWWNKIATGDFNTDGKADLVIGNVGLNTQFHTISDKHPGEMYFADFDSNGSVDPFFCFYIQGTSFPYVTRDEMLEQIPPLRKRFTSFRSYADATIRDIFDEEALEGGGYLKVNHMATSLFLSSPNRKLAVADLPVQTQYSQVNAITVLDYDEDGKDDLLLCGNNSKFKIRIGKMDANYGVLLKGDGRGTFKYIDQSRSGFNLKGDVRSAVVVNGMLLFGINQEAVRAYRAAGKR